MCLRISLKKKETYLKKALLQRDEVKIEMIAKLQGCKNKKIEFSYISKIAVTGKPSNRFKNTFILLKTEISRQILNTEPILNYFRGQRYLQNKMGFAK